MTKLDTACQAKYRSEQDRQILVVGQGRSNDENYGYETKGKARGLTSREKSEKSITRK